MLDYSYRSYFYDQSHKKNILIVSQSCTVTARPGKAPRVDTSNVDNPVVITNDDIIREEFEIDEALNSSNNLSFGTCEAGLIKFTIRHSRRIPFLNEVEEDKAHSEIVKLYFYFDDDSSTLMYYGMYICQRDELSDEGDTRSIECVDLVAMLRDFDIYEWYKWKFLNLEPEDISGQGDAPDPSSNDDEPIPEPKEMTIKQIRDAMFNFINGDEEVPPEIPLDFYVPIQQDDVTLPNDNWKFKYRVTTEKLSFMQMLEDICEINGTFGHIGRKLITATDRCVFEYVTLPRYDVEIDNWNKIRNNYATRNFKHDYFITKGIRTLTIYNNEAKEIARYEKGIPVDDHGNKNYNAYSEYIIYDNKFIDDVEDDSEEAESYTNMLKNIYGSIRYRTYKPYEITVQADLCREVGDRIGIVNDFDPYDNKDLSKEKFKTYILEKVTKGIQNMTDTYTAKGDRVIPKFGDSSSSSGYYSYTGGGYTVSSNPGNSEKSSTESNEGNVVKKTGTTPDDLIAYLRNVGIRLLAEPKVEYVMTDQGPSFRWEDPADITNNRPCPATWAGTVVVRKKGSAPKNRWDFKSATGGLLVNSTTRNEYKDDPIIDDGSVLPARNQSFNYYYGIFPYDTDGHYRFTKVVKVKRQSLSAPSITGINQNCLKVTVNFIIPNVSYEYIKLVYKKDGIPESSSDGTAINLQQGDTSKIVNIEFGSGEYYFVIFASNGNGNEAESNEVSFSPSLNRVTIFEGEVKDADIAITNGSFGATSNTAWAIYINEDNELKIRNGKIDTNITSTKFEDYNIYESATACAIAFDSDLKHDDSGKQEFVTKGHPWIFYVSNGNLYAYQLYSNSQPLQLANNVKDVTVARGPSGMYGTWNFGLIVSYLTTNGYLFYVQLINGTWYDPVSITAIPSGINVDKIQAFMTWDYRYCLQLLTDNGDMYELFSYSEGLGTRMIEHVSVSASANGGFVWGLPPVVVDGNTINDGTGNYGRYVELEIDHDSTGGSYTDFVLIDSNGIRYKSTSYEINGKIIKIGFIDFNYAYLADTVTVQYTPGTIPIHGPDKDMLAWSYTFVPTGLVRPTIDPPEPIRIYNL